MDRIGTHSSSLTGAAWGVVEELLEAAAGSSRASCAERLRVQGFWGFRGLRVLGFRDLGI